MSDGVCIKKTVVAVHMLPGRIGLLRSKIDRIGIGAAGLFTITPKSARRCTGARGIFPLGFAGQPVALTGF